MVSSRAKRICGTFLLIIVMRDYTSALAPQTSLFLPGDVRSTGSGSWNSPAIWERFDGVTWRPAATSPDSSFGTITIRSGHIVTMTMPLVYNQVVVESGAQVVVAAGVTHVLSDGPGTDLTIEGVWLNQGGTWTVIGNARWAVTSTGVFIHHTTSGISTPLSKATLSPGSTFTYRGGPALVPSSTFAGKTYGSLRFESAGGPYSISASGSTSLVIGGDLVIGGGVKWNTGGFTGNITVRGSTVIEGEWGGSGTAAFGVHTFEGHFSLTPGGKYTLSTTAAQSGPIVFKGDMRCGSTLALPKGRLAEFSGFDQQTLEGPANIVLGGGAVARAVLNISQGSTIELGAQQKIVLHADLMNAGQIVGADSLTLLQLSDTCSMVTNNGSVLVPALFDSAESVRSVTGNGTWTTIIVPRQSSVRFSGMHTFAGAGSSLDVRGSAIFEEGSSIKYQGPLRQEISPQSYADLVIENGADVVLGGPTTVNGHLEVRTGNLLTGTHILTLGDKGRLEEGVSGMIIGTVSATRRLNHTNEESFGSIGFSVQVPASPGSEITVTRKTDTVYGLASGRTLPRSFRVTGSSALTSGRTTVQYRTGELNGVRESRLELFGSRNDGADWIRLGGVADTLSHMVTFVGDCSFPLLTIAEPFPSPRIVQMVPATAEQGSTTDITIIGSGFACGVPGISFSGTGVRCDAVSVLNDKCMIAKVSVDLLAFLGSRNVSVVTPGGSDTFVSGITITKAGNPVPRLLSLAPERGARLATVTITLHGSGFVEGQTTVSLGEGIEITPHVLDPTLIVIEARIDETASTGFRNVLVQNPEPGGGVSELYQGFMVQNPLPTLTSISPQKLVKGESQEVTILGSNFIRGETRIEFGNGPSIISFEVVSSSRIKALVHVDFLVERGARTLTAWNPGPGGGRTTLASAVVITDPPPRVASVSPQRICRGSSVSILLSGRGFVPVGMVLSLGSGINVDSLVVIDSTQLRARLSVADGALPGARDLIVANRGPDGESSILHQALCIDNPTPQIKDLNPSGGVLGSRVEVMVHGEGLLVGTTSVDFGDGIEIDSALYDDRGRRMHVFMTVSATTPPGQRSVKATNPAPGGGEGEFPGSFTLTYPAPSLKSVRPARGGRGETLDIVLDGANFIPGVTTVGMNSGVSVDSVFVLSPVQLRARITISPEAIIGARSIVVTNQAPGGGVARLNHVFNIENPQPRIVKVEPSILWRGERAVLHLHGTGFSAGSTIVHPGADVVVESTYIKSTSMVVLIVSVPAGIAPGSRDVSVTNTGAGGGRAVLPNALVLQNPPPEADSSSPSVGLSGESLSILVSGRRFLEGVTSVSLGEGIAIEYMQIQAQTLHARIMIDGAAIPGPRDLTVTNAGPGGGVFVLRNAMVIRPRVPSYAHQSSGPVPSESGIVGAYPNPANSTVTVRYGLAERARVRLVVRNILGVEVAQLVDSEQREGFYTTRWLSDQVPSGVYFIQLSGDPTHSSRTFRVTQKHIILK